MATEEADDSAPAPLGEVAEAPAQSEPCAEADASQVASNDGSFVDALASEACEPPPAVAESEAAKAEDASEAATKSEDATEAAAKPEDASEADAKPEDASASAAKPEDAADPSKLMMFFI